MKHLDEYGRGTIQYDTQQQPLIGNFPKQYLQNNFKKKVKNHENNHNSEHPTYEYAKKSKPYNPNSFSQQVLYH